MNSPARIRTAIFLTVGALLGTLVAATLLLFHGTWITGAVVTNAVVQTRDGRRSVTRLLSHMG